ncbi:pro-thyrotropin-releasing hormone isoform X3 [Carassius carassius]|uniref:pro-thyrotropin-releasing hormone isoform X3 n=1 Tax=Carassius carassius TaxID=217509 RepID=UPI0028695831|nr:pro-thyrotropin-releasing hormone isoform X3 [Carassius carassius]
MCQVVCVISRTQLVMRVVCVILLASLTVCVSPGVQTQTLPGDSDPSLDELLQLLGSMLSQMEDENYANGEQTAWLEKRQHPGKREEDSVRRLRRQHPGKRLMLEEPSEQSELHKRQHPGKRLCEDCDPASVLLELLDRSSGEEKRQHPGKRLELEDELTERE